MRRRVRILVIFMFGGIVLLLGTLCIGVHGLWIGFPMVALFCHYLIIDYKHIHYINGAPVRSFLPKLLTRSRKPWSTGENWLISLSFWIPKRFREAIVGDILEDCIDLRKCGYSEWRIRIHAVWHFILAVLLMWPDVLLSPIFGIIERAFSIRKE
jgi:hypothetical protein